ncbi:unnamed protein product, partial [Vitis vinifera]|uniref:Uncharacterized protein n=1 Tax=Vitis vinifera TaxID=29760 RepID=D7UDS6_VITVI
MIRHSHIHRPPPKAPFSLSFFCLSSIFNCFHPPAHLVG